MTPSAVIVQFHGVLLRWRRGARVRAFLELVTPCAIAARTPRVLRWLGGVRVRVHLALAISRAFVARIPPCSARSSFVRVVQGLATPCAVAVLRRARIGSVDSSRCFKTRLFPARLHLNVWRMCLILLNTGPSAQSTRDMHGGTNSCVSVHGWRCACAC